MPIIISRLLRQWREPSKSRQFSSAAAWRRQHDETSKIIRNAIITLLLLTTYCIATLANNPDTILLTPQAEIKLPIANITLSFGTFLTIGPLALILINLYLHYFYSYCLTLKPPEHEKPEEALKLPYLINMEGLWARSYRLLILYWFVPLTLGYFAWKAAPRDEGLFISALAIIVALILFGLRIWHSRKQPIGFWRGLIRVIILTFLVTSSVIVLYGRNPMKRGLDLSNVDLRSYSLNRGSLSNANLSRGLQESSFDWSNLEAVDLVSADLRDTSFYNTAMSKARMTFADLRNANFFSADMRDVNFFGADLRGAVLHGCDLAGVTLNDANLAGASLRSVTNLSCDQLGWAKNWEQSYRDPELACGQIIPKAESQ